MRHPDTTDDLGLAEVARGDPADDLFDLLILFQHCRLPALESVPEESPARTARAESESDPRARSDSEAPTARSSAPCGVTASNDHRRSAPAGAPPPFSARNARPDRDNRC